MAQLKDTTITGNLSVSGKINQKTIDIDSNCKIIEFCKRLDLSAVNNEVQITLPDGYVCHPTALGSGVCIGVDTYDNLTAPWGTNAKITMNTINAQNDTTYSDTDKEVSHGSFGLIPLMPFCKTYIKAKVTTAAVGTNTYATLFGTIYCKKL